MSEPLPDWMDTSDPDIEEEVTREEVVAALNKPVPPNEPDWTQQFDWRGHCGDMVHIGRGNYVEAKMIQMVVNFDPNYPTTDDLGTEGITPVCLVRTPHGLLGAYLHPSEILRAKHKVLQMYYDK